MRRRKEASVRSALPYDLIQLAMNLPPSLSGGDEPAPKPSNTSGSSAAQLLDPLGSIDDMITAFGKVQKMITMLKEFAPLLEIISPIGAAQAAIRAKTTKNGHTSNH